MCLDEIKYKRALFKNVTIIMTIFSVFNIFNLSLFEFSFHVAQWLEHGSSNAKTSWVQYHGLNIFRNKCIV